MGTVIDRQYRSNQIPNILSILSIHVNLTAIFSKIPIFRRQNALQLFPLVGFNDRTSKAARDCGPNIGRSVKRIFGGVDDSGGCGFLRNQF